MRDVLAPGQDVQLCMVAVQTSGSPCSLKRGSGQALVRVFGSVNPVNVDLVGRRRRGGEDCDLMYGFVVNRVVLRGFQGYRGQGRGRSGQS